MPNVPEPVVNESMVLVGTPPTVVHDSDVLVEEAKSKAGWIGRNQYTILEPVIEDVDPINHSEDDRETLQKLSNSSIPGITKAVSDSKPPISLSSSKTVSFSLTNQLIEKDTNYPNSPKVIQPLFFSTTTTLTTPVVSTSYKPNIHMEINNLVSSMSSLRQSASGSYYSHSSAQTLEMSRVMSLQSSESNEVRDNILQQELMDKAVIVIRRVRDKLTGLDFSDAKQTIALDVSEQVDKLIKNATSNENLSLSFFGW